MFHVLDVLKEKGKLCCGCGACYNICPTRAIKMEKNPQGFLYPQTIPNLCIECQKCAVVCPKLHPFKENTTTPDCYAARASDEIRSHSSSGGMFTLIAEWVIDQGGIVCGAASTEDYGVHHICIERRDEIEKLRLSKYAQSDTELAFRQLRNFAEQGRVVCFFGCPCQVAAARNYLKDVAGTAYYIDILCHGVPSTQMWQDYVHENFNLRDVINIDFRNKQMGWTADRLFVKWKNGTTSIIPKPESAYVEGFLRNITLRDGCGDCEFCDYPRSGDLTIGDFWRVKELDASLDDGKGTSVVLINNKAGEFLWTQLQDKLLHSKKVNLSDLKYNRTQAKYGLHPLKERFKKLYPGHTFTEAVMQCRDWKYDIGLVGTHMYHNFGSELTQYALYQTLADMGYSVLMIERPLNCKKPPRPTALFQKMPYPGYALAKYRRSIAEMKELNLKCETFITGSDQLFNNNAYNDYNKFMTLNFVTGNHRKIAYAASFGHDRIWGPDGDRAEESFYMQQFDYFSVREKSAVELCRKEFGVNATQVLDPVFLCSIETYQNLIKNSKANLPKEPFMGVYLINEKGLDNKKSLLEKIAESRGLKLKIITDAHHKNEKARIEDWLAQIQACDFFITDSFHGFCLALIFHKEFLIVPNTDAGETRYASLLELLDLEEHRVHIFEQLAERMAVYQSVPYSQVDQRLDDERRKSVAWLRNAIEIDREKRKPFSAYDILDGRCDFLHSHIDKRCDDLTREIEMLKKAVGLKSKPKRFAKIRVKPIFINRENLQKTLDFWHKNGSSATLKKILNKFTSF